MPNTTLPHEVIAVVDHIATRFRPRRIILFGSRDLILRTILAEGRTVAERSMKPSTENDRGIATYRFVGGVLGHGFEQVSGSTATQSSRGEAMMERLSDVTMADPPIVNIVGDLVALGPHRRDLFTAVGPHSVMLTVAEYNLAGRRAYEKAGFREFGRRRQCRWTGGRLWDDICMDCLATEFTNPVLARIFAPDEPRP